MAIEMTRKDVRESFSRVFRGDIGEMKMHLEKVGYNCGVYGWNFSVYRVGSAAIVTGYRNLIGEPLPPAAIQILENVRKYRRAEKFGGVPGRAEKYMIRAKKKLEKVLNAL